MEIKHVGRAHAKTGIGQRLQNNRALQALDAAHGFHIKPWHGARVVIEKNAIVFSCIGLILFVQIRIDPVKLARVSNSIKNHRAGFMNAALRLRRIEKQRTVLSHRISFYN